MAHLCGEGTAGWLLSSHISWLLDRANKCQETSFCLCLSTMSPDLLRRLAAKRDKSKVKQLVIIANVGRNPDGTVYLATQTRSGNHWVVITIDLNINTIKYCDSLGWDMPPNLVTVLAGYTQHFGLPMLKGSCISLMHVPSALGYSHKCSNKCMNYPVQECGNVCGVIASICAVVAALDNSLFRELTGTRSGHRRFLHEPTKYEKYLRRVLICWFMTDNLELSLLTPKPRNINAQHLNEHSYSCHPKILRKRKSAEPSETNSMEHSNAHNQAISNTTNQIDFITNNLAEQRSNCEISIQNIQSQSSTCTNIELHDTVMLQMHVVRYVQTQHPYRYIMI